jgi:predicted transposase YbfD/YdcC
LPKKSVEICATKGLDYLFKVKANQKNLFQAIQETTENAIPLDSHRSMEMNKGRTEIRELEVYPFPEHFQKDWKNAKVCIKLTRSGIREGKPYLHDNYYMSSLCEEAKTFQEYIRAYWGVENDLHGSLDRVYQEDDTKMKITNLPPNLSIIRRIALNKIFKKYDTNVREAQQEIFNNIEKILQLLE